MVRNQFVIQVRRNAEVFSKVGVVSSPSPKKKFFESGQNFIHKELSYRGAILYPWPGTTVDAEGESEKTLFYQVLVDQRDAEELPMEHELLRISDSDREAFDFSPTRFKNWDIVTHNEIFPFDPIDASLGVKHHLMHHFLKTFYSYKYGTPSWEVKRTPTLTYWMNKFSSKPLVCHVAEAEFDVDIDENDEDTSELKDVVSVHVIPYHLTTNNVQNFNFIGHLTRFSSKNKTEYEIIERTVIAENEHTGDLKEDTAKLNIALGGEYNNIYQHSRHIQIPHGESHLVFNYRIKRISDQLEKDIMVSAFNISSKPNDELSQI